jgi:choline dehydrogenase-like flavoprotein
MFDVCVVGGGTVGLFLAAQQSARGKSVIVLEAGRGRGDNKDLLLGPRPVSGSHRGSQEAWTTGLGGTSQLWGGQLWPWQEWEFAGQSQRGISAWPLEYGEIRPYYEQVLRALRLPATHAQIHGHFGAAGKLPTMSESDYALRYSSWLSRSRRNFHKNSVIRSNLKNATVRQGLVVNRVSAIGAGSSEIEVRDSSGNLSKIAARNIVLTAGTLGTARILRNSEIAQDLPALGRGFLDHVSKRIAQFDVVDWDKFRGFSAPKKVRGVLASPRVVPSLDFMNRHELLPCYAHWEFASPRSGAVASVRSWLRAGQTGDRRPAVSTILADLNGESGELAEALTRSVRFGERPVPKSSLPYLRLDVQQPTRTDVQLEWTENEAKPEYPNLSLSWRTGSEESDTAAVMSDRLLTCLNSLDIGATGHKLPADGAFEDIFHMMGGTRMAVTSTDGVVDSDSMIFGTDNIFIAGASVFPSGGMANPTFTALALAARIDARIAG